MNVQHNEIQRLRTKNIAKTLEGLLVLFGLIFINLLLPSVLVAYVLKPEQLLSQPKALELLPVITFALGAAHLLHVLISNVMREGKARALESELSLGLATVHSNSELVELEKLVAASLTKKTPKSTARKKTKRKTSKKKAS